MQIKVEFKYFPGYEKWASLVNRQCNCEDKGPCLEAVYFEDPDIEDPVCLNDLVDGRVRVYIPPYLSKKLKESVQKYHPAWNNDQINSFVVQTEDVLSRTPPIPWIQQNAWPVCCGDFCCYLGEWDRAILTETSPDGDGLAFLWSILEEQSRQRREKPDNLWQELENKWATVYVFRCFVCEKIIGVEQSY